MSGIFGNASDATIRTLVWNTSTLAWEAMTQPLIKTDTLTVTSTTDLTKYGGSSVGTSNAIHVQSGTGASFAVTNATFATAAKQLADNHQVTVSNIASTPLITGFATSANQGKFNGAVSGLSTWKEADGKPRVSSMPYPFDIAEGNISGHTAWTKIGYNPAVTTSMEDLWSYGGEYVFPTAAMTIEVASDSATADADMGTILFTGTCDVGGTTTTMIKAGVDFSATATAGDIIIIDKAATTPEWGVITTAANGSVTFSGGLSMGGSCATARTYQILDASAAKGAMAVKIDYLTTAYAEKTEIIILNTNNQVASVNTDFFRINSFRVIAVGSKSTPTYSAIGNLSIRKATVASPFYSYIAAGYTRARNIIYTVPTGKTLYITQWSAGAATPNDTKVQTCRIMTRANLEPATRFKGAGDIFYTYTELLVSNAVEHIDFVVPTKLPAQTDIRVSAIGLTGFSGAVTTVLRGWLE